MASRCYAQAASIERTYTILGGIIGGSLAWFARVPLAIMTSPQTALIGMLVLFLLASAMGHMMAAGAAFKLRFEAQSLLLLVEIEKNTRR